MNDKIHIYYMYDIFSLQKEFNLAFFVNFENPWVVETFYCHIIFQHPLNKYKHIYFMGSRCCDQINVICCYFCSNLRNNNTSVNRNNNYFFFLPKKFFGLISITKKLNFFDLFTLIVLDSSFECVFKTSKGPHPHPFKQ